MSVGNVGRYSPPVRTPADTRKGAEQKDAKGAKENDTKGAKESRQEVYFKYL